MGFFGNLFGLSEEKVRKTCILLYEKTRDLRPEKPVRDCLKIVLLTKPPFDYQHDRVIEMFLDEYTNIDELADYISIVGSKDPLSKDYVRRMFESRARNLKRLNVKERNKLFFVEFWGTG